MKRKIYNELLNWKNTESGRTALLIDGARRVDKSYLGFVGEIGGGLGFHYEDY